MSKPKPIEVVFDRSSEGERYRLLQAQALLDDFERDQGRPATDIKALETWVTANKSKAITKKPRRGQ
jgi:hypothetical protein